MSSTEEWRPVVGREDEYHVSDQGRVKSFARGAPRILRPGIGGHGYPTVALGRGKTRTLHSLVAEAFIGPRPAGQEIRHIDGNRKNPVLSNLVYGPRAYNNHDRAMHNRYPYTVAQIAEMRNSGLSVPALHREYGINKSYAYRVIRGEARPRG